MRYIIINSKLNREKLERETSNRIKYIREVFGLYMIVNNNTDYDKGIVLLDPIFLKDDIDYFFIVGHNRSVYDYIMKNIDNIQEANLVLVCCSIDPIDKLKLKNKEIYISKNVDGLTDCFNGKEWGFSFDISFSEIDLYNNRKLDVSDNIKRSFCLLSGEC